MHEVLPPGMLAERLCCLPNGHALILGNEHGVALGDSESIIPCVYVRHLAVHTPPSQLVRVALDALAHFLVAYVLPPYVGISQEETLGRREAILVRERCLCGGIDESLIGNHQSAMVCHVLTQGERPVGMQSGQNLDAVMVYAHLSELIYDNVVTKCDCKGVVTAM